MTEGAGCSLAGRWAGGAVVELRRKRQKLLDEIDELHAARTQPRTLKGRLGATMAAGEPGSGAGAGDGLDPDAVQELVIRQTAAEKKLRDWVDVHGAYRLAGRTVFPDRDSTVAVRFETLFGGTGPDGASGPSMAPCP